LNIKISTFHTISSALKEEQRKKILELEAENLKLKMDLKLSESK